MQKTLHPEDMHFFHSKNIGLEVFENFSQRIYFQIFANLFLMKKTILQQNLATFSAQIYLEEGGHFSSVRIVPQAILRFLLVWGGGFPTPIWKKKVKKKWSKMVTLFFKGRVGT